MKSMTIVRTAVLGAVLATAFVGSAGAVPLPAATTVGLPGTTAAARPELAGLVLEDVDQPFSFIDSTGHTLSGVVQNRVVRSSVDGTLDFYWRIKDTAGVSASGDPGAITAFRVGGFGNLALDADWRMDGLGTIHPAQAHRFPNPSFVNFLFDGPALVPTNDSVFFFLDTQATSYAKVGFYDFTGTGGNGISASFATFAPIPEPSSLVILGGGLFAFLVVARRRL